MNAKKKATSIFDNAEELNDSINKYFSEYLPQSGEIADIESLADYLGSTRDEINLMLTDETNGVILKRAKNRIAKIKKQLAFCGKIPATVLSFDLKNNHGYKDKPEETDTPTHESVVFKGKATQWAQ